MAETDGLWERIAEALWKCNEIAAVGRSYYPAADAVLVALGLEQVGWLRPSGNLVGRPEANAHESCLPVYVIRGDS